MGNFVVKSFHVARGIYEHPLRLALEGLQDRTSQPQDPQIFAVQGEATNDALTDVMIHAEVAP